MSPIVTAKSKGLAGLARPPPGVTPNFDNPMSRGGPIIVVNIISLLLSTCVLFLRVYTRRFIVRLMDLSDCKQSGY